MTFKVQTLSFSTKTSLKISKGDISRWCVDRSSDAIVSPTNEILLLGGFTAAAIHEAAGPDLQKACYQIPEAQPRVRCPPGEARITPGFKLPVSHVIHTVGPVFNFHCNPEDILRSAYKNCLSVGKANNIQYIAFPAISCGVSQIMTHAIKLQTNCGFLESFWVELSAKVTTYDMDLIETAL
ncbi:hypothetical protein CISIN_1g029637mg [Citrus sinensis]|uniref:Macro domain-containing protein n=1 Tax=Citrus sinensis TaxID=2711 RepID=A0A067DM74_CITSI|nr:hypothetical protein CISIN_1g029637mg [Citrus sinensis]